VADLLIWSAMSKAKLADPATDPVLRRFRAALENGFELKRIADYFEIGDRDISSEEARDAIGTATHFVDRVEALLR
jgi:hypothetical protein